jgi:hypothetical protein
LDDDPLAPAPAKSAEDFFDQASTDSFLSLESTADSLGQGDSEPVSLLRQPDSTVQVQTTGLDDFFQLAPTGTALFDSGLREVNAISQDPLPTSESTKEGATLIPDVGPRTPVSVESELFVSAGTESAPTVEPQQDLKAVKPQSAPEETPAAPEPSAVPTASLFEAFTQSGPTGVASQSPLVPKPTQFPAVEAVEQPSGSPFLPAEPESAFEVVFEPTPLVSEPSVEPSVTAPTASVVTAVSEPAFEAVFESVPAVSEPAVAEPEVFEAVFEPAPAVPQPAAEPSVAEVPATTPTVSGSEPMFEVVFETVPAVPVAEPTFEAVFEQAPAAPELVADPSVAEASTTTTAVSEPKPVFEIAPVVPEPAVAEPAPEPEAFEAVFESAPADPAVEPAAEVETPPAKSTEPAFEAVFETAQEEPTTSDPIVPTPQPVVTTQAEAPSAKPVSPPAITVEHSPPVKHNSSSSEFHKATKKLSKPTALRRSTSPVTFPTHEPQERSLSPTGAFGPKKKKKIHSSGSEEKPEPKPQAPAEVLPVVAEAPVLEAQARSEPQLGDKPGDAISAQESSLLQRLKRAVSKELARFPIVTDKELFLFLLVKKMDVKTAAERFKNYAQWAEQEGFLNGVTLESLDRPLVNTLYAFSPPDARDKAGSLIVYVRPAQAMPFKQFSPKDFTRLLYFQYRRTLEESIEVHRKGVTFVLDMAGFRLRDAMASAPSTTSDIFPVRVARILAVNMKATSRMALGLFKLFSKAKILERLSSVKVPQLAAEIPEHSLLAAYGGSLTYSPEDFYGQGELS